MGYFIKNIKDSMAKEQMVDRSSSLCKRLPDGTPTAPVGTISNCAQRHFPVILVTIESLISYDEVIKRWFRYEFLGNLDLLLVGGFNLPF